MENTHEVGHSPARAEREKKSKLPGLHRLAAKSIPLDAYLQSVIEDHEPIAPGGTVRSR